MNARQRRLLRRLRQVPAGATLCPGKLARDCGTTLREARPDLLGLARAGRVVLSQRGRPVAPDAIKGPFRIRLSQAAG